MKRNLEYIPFEDALEDLTELGLDPSLIFDDNGKWACGGTSCGNIVSEPGVPYETHIHIDGDNFEDTPRKAVQRFVEMCIEHDEEEPEDELPEGVEAICENCGKPAPYHSNYILCEECKASREVPS